MLLRRLVWPRHFGHAPVACRARVISRTSTCAQPHHPRRRPWQRNRTHQGETPLLVSMRRRSPRCSSWAQALLPAPLQFCSQASVLTSPKTNGEETKEFDVQIWFEDLQQAASTAGCTALQLREAWDERPVHKLSSDWDCRVTLYVLSKYIECSQLSEKEYDDFCHKLLRHLSELYLAAAAPEHFSVGNVVNLVTCLSASIRGGVETEFYTEALLTIVAEEMYIDRWSQYAPEQLVCMLHEIPRELEPQLVNKLAVLILSNLKGTFQLMELKDIVRLLRSLSAHRSSGHFAVVDTVVTAITSRNLIDQAEPEDIVDVVLATERVNKTKKLDAHVMAFLESNFTAFTPDQKLALSTSWERSLRTQLSDRLFQLWTEHPEMDAVDVGSTERLQAEPDFTARISRPQKQHIVPSEDRAAELARLARQVMHGFAEFEDTKKPTYEESKNMWERLVLSRHRHVAAHLHCCLSVLETVIQLQSKTGEGKALALEILAHIATKYSSNGAMCDPLQLVHFLQLLSWTVRLGVTEAAAWHSELQSIAKLEVALGRWNQFPTLSPRSRMWNPYSSLALVVGVYDALQVPAPELYEAIAEYFVDSDWTWTGPDTDGEGVLTPLHFSLLLRAYVNSGHRAPRLYLSCIYYFLAQDAIVYFGECIQAMVEAVHVVMESVPGARDLGVIRLVETALGVAILGNMDTFSVEQLTRILNLLQSFSPELAQRIRSHTWTDSGVNEAYNSQWKIVRPMLADCNGPRDVKAVFEQYVSVHEGPSPHVVMHIFVSYVQAGGALEDSFATELMLIVCSAPLEKPEVLVNFLPSYLVRNQHVRKSVSAEVRDACRRAFGDILSHTVSLTTPKSDLMFRVLAAGIAILNNSSGIPLPRAQEERCMDFLADKITALVDQWSIGHVSSFFDHLRQHAGPNIFISYTEKQQQLFDAMLNSLPAKLSRSTTIAQDLNKLYNVAAIMLKVNVDPVLLLQILSGKAMDVKEEAESKDADTVGRSNIPTSSIQNYFFAAAGCGYRDDELEEQLFEHCLSSHHAIHVETSLTILRCLVIRGDYQSGRVGEVFQCLWNTVISYVRRRHLRMDLVDLLLHISNALQIEGTDEFKSQLLDMNVAQYPAAAQVMRQIQDDRDNGDIGTLQQQKISQVLQPLWPHSKEVAVLPGMHVDMANQETKTAIEYDGPFHFIGRRRNGFTLMRNRLLKKLGYDLVCISYHDVERYMRTNNHDALLEFLKSQIPWLEEKS